MSSKVTYKSTYNLKNQNDFFGGWPVIKDSPEEFGIVISFPIEGWNESASVTVTQRRDGSVTAECYGATSDSQKAIDQALATLSLDVDDGQWEQIGKQDKVIGALQVKYGYLRPMLFHSPYEAAAGFVIGQRISVKQRQALQKKMAELHGQKITIEDNSYYAFPSPQALLDIHEFSGLSDIKIKRLHGIAEAALTGSLDRSKLLKMSEADALAYLQTLEGIGPFYANGILYRGAGIVDGVTGDTLTKYAIQKAYDLETEPSQSEVLDIAENWRPYRMWAEVLIHVWLRREVGLPKR